MGRGLAVGLIAAVVGIVGVVPAHATVPAKNSAFCTAFTKNSPANSNSSKQVKKWAKSLSKAAKGAPSDVQSAIQSMKSSASAFKGGAKNWASSPEALEFATASLTVSVYALSECTAGALTDLEGQLKNLGK